MVFSAIGDGYAKITDKEQDNVNESDTFVRFPIPSSDPNDPLVCQAAISPHILKGVSLTQRVTELGHLAQGVQFCARISPDRGGLHSVSILFVSSFGIIRSPRFHQ